MSVPDYGAGRVCGRTSAIGGLLLLCGVFVEPGRWTRDGSCLPRVIGRGLRKWEGALAGCGVHQRIKIRHRRLMEGGIRFHRGIHGFLLWTATNGRGLMKGEERGRRGVAECRAPNRLGASNYSHRKRAANLQRHRLMFRPGRVGLDDARWYGHFPKKITFVSHGDTSGCVKQWVEGVQDRWGAPQ